MRKQPNKRSTGVGKKITDAKKQKPYVITIKRKDKRTGVGNDPENARKSSVVKCRKHNTTRRSMIVVKGRTFYNIAKESILHPLRTSVIDTKSGDTIIIDR